MHTGYVPNPTIEHPSYGSVVAHELADKNTQLDIPPFVSIDKVLEIAPRHRAGGPEVAICTVRHGERRLSSHEA